MVQAVSPNVVTGYSQPVQNAGALTPPPANNTHQASLQQQPTIDEFVSQLESEHKKAIVKKNIVGASVAGGSLLALLGGTLAKTRWGRALSVAPLALTTLAFGVTTLLKGNKTPDYRALLENIQAGANTGSHRA